MRKSSQIVLANHEETFLAALFLRSRMKNRTRRHTDGYLPGELDGLTLNEKQAFRAMVSTAERGLVLTKFIPGTHSYGGDTVCKLTDEGERFVRENILVSATFSSVRNVVLDNVNRGSETSRTASDSEDDIAFLRWSVHATREMDRLEALNDPAVKLRITKDTSDALEEVLREVIARITSSNIIAVEDKDIWTSTLRAAMDLIKSRWFYGSVVLYLILKPIYEAFTSTVEDNLKPYFQFSFEKVIELLGL